MFRLFRINYLPPDRLPSHQRDFPRQRPSTVGQFAGSYLLGLLVAGYLVILFVAIGLLGAMGTTLPTDNGEFPVQTVMK
jgi:hypothetical protein